MPLGGISRGIGPAYRERSLAFDPRDIKEAPGTVPGDTLANGQPRPAPAERTDNPALFLSAAQQSQTAKEMPLSAGATEPHGAFTAALLETLETMPADTPAALVYERVRAVLEGGSVPDQDPDLDASEVRRQQPLFGGTAAKSSKIRAAALGIDEDGNVTLDIGRAAGLGQGSEFASENPGSDGKPVLLRISDSTALRAQPPKSSALPAQRWRRASSST